MKKIINGTILVVTAAVVFTLFSDFWLLYREDELAREADRHKMAADATTDTAQKREELRLQKEALQRSAKNKSRQLLLRRTVQQ